VELAKEDPHIFGPHARQYFLDTLEMEREQQEAQAALRKAYGPPSPNQPKYVSTLLDRPLSTQTETTPPVP